MSLAYFPMYADRYEADTAHLSILEDGAYNRLLRLCWRSPACKLPNDLAWIFRQCRAVSDADQAAVTAVLDEFFTKSRGKIWNKKLSEIHVQVSVAHSNKSEAGKKGAAAKALKNNKSQPSTAKAELKQPEPEPEPKREEKKEGGGGSAQARENHDLISENQPQTFREKILTAIGVDPVSGLTGHGGRQLGTQGDMAEASRWLDLPNISESVVVEEIRRITVGKRDGPPKSFLYFTEPMQRLSATLSAPALQPIQPNPQTAQGGRNERHRQGNAVALELARRIGSGEIELGPDGCDPWTKRQ